MYREIYHWRKVLLQMKDQSHQPACVVVKLTHHTGVKKSVPECFEIVKNMRLCFNCLKRGHQVNECSSKEHCKVANCNKYHHALLHYERKNDEQLPTIQNLHINSSSSTYIHTYIHTLY